MIIVSRPPHPETETGSGGATWSSTLLLLWYFGNKSYGTQSLQASLPWRDVIVKSYYRFNVKEAGAMKFSPCMPGLGQGWARACGSALWCKAFFFQKIHPKPNCYHELASFKMSYPNAKGFSVKKYYRSEAFIGIGFIRWSSFQWCDFMVQIQEGTLSGLHILAQ